MSLPYAPSAEQLKSSHKDEYSISVYQDELRELAASLLGRRSVAIESELQLFANATYYACSTLFGMKIKNMLVELFSVYG
jgi:3-methyladenine DNA glycosylase AlkD